jgi:hypothetical protein
MIEETCESLKRKDEIEQKIRIRERELECLADRQKEGVTLKGTDSTFLPPWARICTFMYAWVVSVPVPVPV